MTPTEITDSRGTVRSVSQEPVPECHREPPLCIVDGRNAQGMAQVQGLGRLGA